MSVPIDAVLDCVGLAECSVIWVFEISVTGFLNSAFFACGRYLTALSWDSDELLIAFCCQTLSLGGLNTCSSTRGLAVD